MHQLQLALPSTSCSILFFSFTRSRYLSLFLLTFIITLWRVHFFLFLFSFLLTITRSSSRDLVIPFYLKTPSKSVHLIVLDRFRVENIALISMVKSKFLAKFPVDHLPRPVVSSLILFLRYFDNYFTIWKFFSSVSAGVECFTGVLVSASFLWFPRLFYVSKLIFEVLWSEWFWFSLKSLVHRGPFTGNLPSNFSLLADVKKYSGFDCIHSFSDFLFLQSFFLSLLRTVPSAPTTIGITVSFIFQFFTSLASRRYLYDFLFYFIFTQ